ncbi:MAG: hypothetical protein ACUVQ0_01810 [Thermoproteota archaeon]
MNQPKKKGYIVERKIRTIFSKEGWITIRSGGSLGFADIVCLKDGKCVLLQVKSTRRNVLYVEKRIPSQVEGFPLYVVVDFGHGNIRVFKPGGKMSREEGMPLEEFLRKNRLICFNFNAKSL